MRDIPFQFEVPIDFFEKASAPKGKQRRIGGLISTETPDRQGETVLQNGLDFSNFLKHGWFNDNHDKGTAEMVGYPELVKRVKQGEKLPNGVTAPAIGTWCEGHMLNNDRANRIWKMGQDLKKTNRRLGYSLEGTVTHRSGLLRKTVARAKVRNVAITNCPVNTDSRLDLLVKSLDAMNRDIVDEAMDKALGMGPPSATAPVGPQTGMGAGAVLAPESLESVSRILTTPKKKKKDKLSKAEAVVWLQTRYPGLATDTAQKLFVITQALKTRGSI